MSKVHSTNRLTGVFFAFIIFYIIILLNLFLIQIRSNSFFKNLAEQQYRIVLTTKPIRAEIFDRNNRPLAINKDGLSAFLIPSEIKQEQELKNFLEINFPQAYYRLKENQNQHFFYIKRKLTDEQIKIIKDSNLSDIKLLKEPSRYYPVESLASIVGITNIDNQGTMGLELTYNSQLEGKSGTALLCKDARSGYFHFKKEKKIKGIKGTPLKTTIDSVLQFLVYEELKDTIEKLNAKSGAILIMDPMQGDIFVMSNYPDFDPNNTEKLDIENTKNKIVADAYEMGSVIKVFLALAALEEGVVSLDEEIDCENRENGKVNGISFSTVKANGIISFSEVIEYSNNIGVAKVALRLGPKLYDHYKKLGFTEKMGVFPSENPGFMTHPSQWSKASLISLSFGYELSSNVLGLAQAFTVVATDGFLVKPKIIYDEIPTKTGPLYKQETISNIKKILKRTAKKVITKNLFKKDYKIIGKTGTARLLTNGEYDPNRLIFTFIGLVEKDNYKRLIITFIKETEQTKKVWASTIAAPLFERIAQKMLIHDKII